MIYVYCVILLFQIELFEGNALANHHNTMPVDFSLYLDAVRFAAAVLVVISHFVQYAIIPASAAAYVPDMGREAVIIFFVLSGFVIMYTVEHKQASLRDYIIARCSRIYSVALPALLAAFAIATGVVMFTDVSIATSYQLAKAYIYIPFHLLFLGEFWNLSETPPWLAPYWSLGYEVWYYVLFATAFYFTGTKRVLATGLVLAMVGFKLWLLLPVWLSGVWLCRWMKTHAIAVTPARVGWLLSIAALCAYKLLDLDSQLRALGNAVWPFPGLVLGSADRYLADYVTGVIILANFMFARYAGFSSLLRVKAITRAMSSHTFTLYIVHGLVIMVWIHLVGHDASNPADILMLSLLIAAMTYLAGFVTERRKGSFERFFNSLFNAAGRLYASGSAGLQRLR